MEKTIAHDDTARALLAMMHDLEELAEAHERVRVQVLALAQRHGVEPAPIE